MLNLSAPAINQLKGEDAEKLISLYMNTPGLTKTHEWSAGTEAKIEVPQTQPSVLRASAPTPGGGGGTRRTAAPTTTENQQQAVEDYTNPEVETETPTEG